MRRTNRHRIGWLAAGLATTLVLTACSAGSTSGSGDGGGEAAQDQPTRLAVGLVGEPASLDFTTTDGAAIPRALLVNVYEGLVKLDENGEIVPLLAKSWEVSDDGLTYTFQLVDGATFSNGDEFTAEDVVFAIERVQSDAWTISLKSYMDVVDTATAVSPTEVQVTLKHPSNSWLYRMTTRIGAMFSESGVDELATKPIGTGPYQLEAWRPGDEIVLTANPDYWGEAPYFDNVALKYFEDPTALNNALLSETIDVIARVQAPESLARFEDRDDLQVIEGSTNSEVVMSLNNKQPPLDDVRVRQAIRYAIDNQALMDTCWAGRGTLIGSHVPPTDPWYEDLTGMYPHDPAKAKALLAEAGQTNLSLRLRLPTLPYAVSCGQVVQSQLADVGIEVQIDQLEFPARWLEEVFNEHNYDMSMVAHVEPRDIPALFGNPDYYLGYDNAQVRQLLDEADRGSRQEQVAKMKEVARIVSEEAAAEWLFLLPSLIVAEKGITGLPKNRISESFDLTRLARA